MKSEPKALYVGLWIEWFRAYGLLPPGEMTCLIKGIPVTVMGANADRRGGFRFALQEGFEEYGVIKKPDGPDGEQEWHWLNDIEPPVSVMVELSLRLSG
jgi:hypothetical protein